MTKNSGDWEGLQGHDDDPAQFKHKAWVHEGGVAYICIYIYYIYYIYAYPCVQSTIAQRPAGSQGWPMGPGGATSRPGRTWASDKFSLTGHA